MRQAQQMMSNPAFAQQVRRTRWRGIALGVFESASSTHSRWRCARAQAQQAMENMSPEDVKAKLNAGAPPAAPSAPANTSTAAKLRASPMAMPNDVLELVEEAEGQKTIGNKRFKEGDHVAASSRYKQGATLLETVLEKEHLSGADKQAVVDLKHACHLNLANCQLKLEDWAGAERECSVVLELGANRKALFRRGQAYLKHGELQLAHTDLKAAAEMDSSDTIVRAMLTDVEERLGVEKTELPPPATAPASTAPVPPMAGMPPGGMPDPAQMERMLDQMTPEQMKSQECAGRDRRMNRERSPNEWGEIAEYETLGQERNPVVIERALMPFLRLKM